MELSEIGILTLEGSASLMIGVMAIKFYRMRISTHSGCCGDQITIDTHNPGQNPQTDMLASVV